MENPDVATQPASKKQILIIVLAVLLVAVLFGLRSMAGPPSHEGQGTIISVDAAARRATVEAVDPANGNTRDYVGTVSPDCTITINGKPATLEELRPGDSARFRVKSDRSAPKVDGKRPVVAELIQVTRKEGAAS
jgi:hypothetical protein